MRFSIKKLDQNTAVAEEARMMLLVGKENGGGKRGGFPGIGHPGAALSSP